MLRRWISMALLVSLAGWSGTLAGQETPPAADPTAGAAVPERDAPVPSDPTEPERSPPPTQRKQKLILVVGAPGEANYAPLFATWADRWIQACGQSDEIDLEVIGQSPPAGSLSADLSDESLSSEPAAEAIDEPTDRIRLAEAIESTAATTEVLWIVMIGHGTDDQKRAKFNLRGPDVTAEQIQEWLAPLTCQVVVINCASSSGGFVGKLKAPRRIVVTATKSGAQYNFARFGDYLSQSIADPTLDLDKDHQTSLLEAFVAASRRTSEFYEKEKRLATEMAMLDDNGDGLGTPGDWFQGTRLIKTPEAGVADGQLADRLVLIPMGDEARLDQAQRKRRDELESAIEALRSRKRELESGLYYQQLEVLMLELARLYEGLDR